MQRFWIEKIQSAKSASRRSQGIKMYALGSTSNGKFGSQTKKMLHTPIELEMIIDASNIKTVSSHSVFESTIILQLMKNSVFLRSTCFSSTKGSRWSTDEDQGSLNKPIPIPGTSYLSCNQLLKSLVRPLSPALTH